MEEGISHWGGLPGPNHRRLYRRWGEGGWGLIITGMATTPPSESNDQLGSDASQGMSKSTRGTWQLRTIDLILPPIRRQ